MYEFHKNSKQLEINKSYMLLHAARTGTRTRARLGLVAHARASARLAALALGAAFDDFDDFAPFNDLASTHFPRAAL